MSDVDLVVNLLARGYYAEAAYFAAVKALKESSATAHMMAGAGCCGCVQPIAVAQRVLDNAPIEGEIGSGGLRVSPQTHLPYEGFFHLIQARRLDPSVAAPRPIAPVFDSIADDLAFFSRREFQTSPDRRKKYSLRLASVAAALLLRQLTGSARGLPGIAPATLDAAAEIITTELSQSGGDAEFMDGSRQN